MGRKKQNWKPTTFTERQNQRRDEVLEEKAFRELSRIEGFRIPPSLDDWQGYFSNRGRFLVQASTWLRLRMEGEVWPTITTDISLRKKCYRHIQMLWQNTAKHQLEEIERVKQEEFGFGDEDHWESSREWVAGMGYLNPNGEKSSRQYSPHFHPQPTRKPHPNYWRGEANYGNYAVTLYGKSLPLIPKLDSPTGMCEEKFVVI